MTEARPRPTTRATDRPGDSSPFAIGLLLRRAHARAAAHFLAVMAPYGLELRHFAMLIVLVDRGPTLQRDLVVATGFDKAAIGRAVDDLEAAGLVERHGVAGDRRIWEVHVTDSGVQVFDDAHRDALDVADDLVGHLGPRDVTHLMQLLTRFTYPPD